MVVASLWLVANTYLLVLQENGGKEDTCHFVVLQVASCKDLQCKQIEHVVVVDLINNE